MPAMLNTLETLTLGSDLSKVNRPIILDIEASGFGADSYPIEVGVVLSSGEKYCSLIRPCNDWSHWDEDAEQIHGITRKTLMQHGKPAKLVAQQLNQLLAGKTAYSDGWVVDHSWLNRLFYASGINAEFSFSSLEMILSEKQMGVWHPLKQQVEDTLDLKRHRATNDAIIVQETFALSWLQAKSKAA